MRKTGSGFTIVELLIVIVVIAILAAISMAGYNSLQQRTNNTAKIAAINQNNQAHRPLYGAIWQIPLHLWW